MIYFFFFKNIKNAKTNLKKMAQKSNIFQLFPNAPAPRHPETLPPSKSSRWRCRGTNFHPDWTKWRPSYAHLKFQISTLFQPPPQNTFGHSGIHRPEKRKSSFLHFLLVSFEDSTIAHFPFFRPVIQM